ncbi:MAG: alpha-ketoglutarate-dependent dioxygenase AlkB, partial [Vicinamibacterales bacterium]
MQLHPGLFLFQRYLTPDDQRRLWRECEVLASGPAPMYTPTVRGGRKMSVGMLCLGRHWNALTYAYEARRTDFDGAEVPALPPPFASLAVAAAARAGFVMQPDLCIMNFYSPDSRMGVHQDK